MAAPPPSTPAAHRITGAAGTGKTGYLVKSLRDLFEQGVSPGDIIVFCATPDAASNMKLRLAEAVGAKAGEVPVTTLREYGLAILKTDEGMSFTGRKGHLLADFEMNFLLEDLKVSGLRPKRLREMLKFFYRSWTELADDDPDWLITGEETDIHALLKSALALTQGIIEPEITNLAVNFLRDDAENLALHSRKHVFVDDYQCLSRASQILANMIAADTITVVGDLAGSVEVYESYPYAAGLEEFIQVNEWAETTDLAISLQSTAVTEAVNRLLDDDCMGEAPRPRQSDNALAGSVVSHAFETADLEFEGIASLIVQQIESGLRPHDIFVVTPNQLWNSRICASLAARGIAADSIPAGQMLKGDIRDYERSLALRIYTALKLAADPDDALAWRCWCGYGDYLTNSASFCNIRKLAEERGIGLSEALAGIADGTYDLSGTDKTIAAYHAGKALIAQVAGLRGQALLDGIAAIVSEISAEQIPEGQKIGRRSARDVSTEPTEQALAIIKMLCQPIDSDETADELIKRASSNLIEPRFSLGNDAVRVARANHLCGFSPKTLIYSGFVNGFIPDRDYFDGTKTPLDKQRKIHEGDTRLLYVSLGKAQMNIIFTYFERADLESAELLKLEIERIRLEQGKRMCVIAPSEFLSMIAG